MHVMADGVVSPCHAAVSIPGISFDRATERPLRDIWTSSEAFTRFRGDAWMPEPCRGCERKAIDFGGCRCQALALTGDATRTDPACSRSPDHGMVERATDERQDKRFLHRGRTR